MVVSDNAVMNDVPSVSVVIPNWNGAAHLPDCLDSLQSLAYPHERLEIIVVDNGSTDESVALVEQRSPRVRVLAHPENLGFAAASNSGAHAAIGDYVAFLNNDMRVDREWARQLVDAVDPSAGYVCVGGVILDWEGERIDFVDGWVNFHGFAGQEHFRQPVDERLIEDRRDLLFACGGSMLISRDVFLKLGGFDPGYFAFFEDVDLGWRLWLAGYRVRLAAQSRSFHRHHGTGSALPSHQRALLYERNALITLLKNVGDENLARVLSSALLVLTQRSLVYSGSPRSAFTLGSLDDASTELVERTSIAPLHAVSDVIADLEGILERRSGVQRGRKRSDSEIFALFNHPYAPISYAEKYLEASLKVRHALRLDRLFPRQRATHVLTISEYNSDRMAEITRNAASLTRATFTSAEDEHVLKELLAESDLVIVSGTTKNDDPIAEGALGLLAVDLDQGDGAVSSSLLERADVFLSASAAACERAERMLRAVGRPEASGSPVVMIVPRGGDQLTPLRVLVESPWQWQRNRGGATEMAVSEDLQQLLRLWRERYRGGGKVRRSLRALLRFMPPGVVSSVRGLLRRPRVTA
jgi:GT2 family glycosyltransferase